MNWETERDSLDDVTCAIGVRRVMRWELGGCGGNWCCSKSDALIFDMEL
jgi:hypothetical protein